MSFGAAGAVGCTDSPTAAVVAGQPPTPDQISLAAEAAAERREAGVDGDRGVAAAESDDSGTVTEPSLGTLKLLRGGVVRVAPDPEAEKIGVIVRGTRIGYRQRHTGEGCRWEWIAVLPEGWVCGKVEATDEPVTTERLPQLGQGKRLPGLVGRVRSNGAVFDSMEAVQSGFGRAPEGEMVALKHKVRIAGKTYWRTKRGAYVETRHVARLSGSDWGGIELDKAGLKLPLGFAFSKRNKGREDVFVRSAPRADAGVVRKLERRELVRADVRSSDGAYVQIGDGEWVAREDLRVAEVAEPPTRDVLDETWVDVDLDEQTLIVYRGREPLYVTLISSGRYRHGTPTGVYRVDRKKARTRMRSPEGADDPYDVANVPWTLFFHHGYALHGAYWHDAFGRVKSHGCVNMAPADAAYIFEALGPELPPGWNEYVGRPAHPGGLVRVKNRKNPTPEFRGYAVSVEENATGQRLATR